MDVLDCYSMEIDVTLGRMAEVLLQNLSNTMKFRIKTNNETEKIKILIAKWKEKNYRMLGTFASYHNVE